ncbi:MAG: hypothetical protein K2X66_00070 [Cyanobacteria bacterium]|nr:hypothetical protein [Cyanobacteriota bacterium]
MSGYSFPFQTYSQAPIPRGPYQGPSYLTNDRNYQGQSYPPSLYSYPYGSPPFPEGLSPDKKRPENKHKETSPLLSPLVGFPKKSPVPAHQHFSLPNSNNRPFSKFVRHASPDPPPTKREFYIENLKDNLYKSYKKGFHRYFHNLAQHPLQALGVGTISAALTLLMTTFHQRSRFIETTFIMGLLTFPVLSAVRHFPKMDDAYETTLHGDPQKGEKKFLKALDDSVYEIGHVYLKPLSFALVATAIIGLPNTIRGIYNEQGFLKILKPVLQKLNITHDLPLFKPLNIAFSNLSKVGTKIESALSLKWLSPRNLLKRLIP